MAIWYVRPGGTGSGTGPALNQAWGTFQAPFTSGSGVTGGDTVYIAPGHYNEKITVTITNPTSTVSIIGDVTASQFSGVSAGLVRLSTFATAGTAASSLTAPVFSATTKDFLSFSNIIFEGNPTSGTGSNLVRFITSKNMSFTKCIFVNEVFASATTEPALLYVTPPASVALSLSITKCVFMVSGRNGLDISGNNVADTSSITDTLFQGATTEGLTLRTIQMKVQNCTFMHNGGQAIRIASGSSSFPSSITNCLFYSNGTAITSIATNLQAENYNRFIANLATRSGVDTGANSSTVGATRLDYGYSRIVGLNPIDFYGPQQESPNQAFGTSTGAEATDVMSIAWTGVTPDSGYQTFSNAVGAYYPTERNASTITIAPGSTSQSIELYLGVTGLTASTSGLSARYNRTRTASVDIPLVARTIAQAWTAGGFSEVDATNMPGVYRLDVPDAALAAGADDVTVVVRGASGTNGAVMTVKLSSGGLTEAQTASAVWGASPAGYNDATTFGGVVNQIDQTVTGIDTQVQDVAGNVWDELKVNHTIPNSFGDYLDTKVSTGADTSRIQLRQGPFLIKQNAIDSVITEVNQFLSTVPNIEMVLIDSSGGSVSVAGATLVMRVRNQAGTAVVNNVTPTVAYADGGVIRWSPNLSWTALGVTTAGTYRIVVERTMSGVTTTFGPFLVQLSSG